MSKRLQIKHLHVVPHRASASGNQLKTERLQPQKYLGKHQRTGMN
jgi:hypothetical protein